MTMNINTELIKSSNEKLLAKLEELGDICNISDYKPDNGKYENKKYQYIYALRYLTAYYFEYCEMAHYFNEIIKNLKDFTPSILSLGCGLGQDYIALLNNLKKFKYSGYDVVDWSKTREYIFDSTFNGKFLNQSISEVDDIEKYNTFIFPKSIMDIYEQKDELSEQGYLIKEFAGKISKSNQRKLFFLNSYVINEEIKKQSLKSHMEPFDKIDDYLKNEGYTKIIHKNVTGAKNKLNDRLRSINNNHSLKIPYITPFECNQKSPPNKGACYCDLSKNEEKECGIIKTPIVSESFICYQIIEYKK